MEETLFECTYTDSEEILYDAYRHIRYKKEFWIGLVATIAGSCLTAYSLWAWAPKAVFFSAIVLAYGIYGLLYPKICSKRIMKHILRSNGGEIPLAKVTITDRLTHQYKLNTTNILFADITEVYFLRRCIVIIGRESYLTFDCSGFTKGTPEELEMFLRQKCPNAKFIYKGRKKSTERV